MGISKTEIFSFKQNEIAGLAKAFAHPARVAILEQLFKQNACVCGDLVQEIGLAQATISQHLKELKSLGLIQGNVEGSSVCYCINMENWTKMKSVLHEFINRDLYQNTCN
jgi:predicted transcriptional regulator